MITYKQLMETLKYTSDHQSQLINGKQRGYGQENSAHTEHKEEHDHLSEHHHIDNDQHAASVQKYTEEPQLTTALYSRLNSKLRGQDKNPLNPSEKTVHNHLTAMHKTNPPLKQEHHVYSNFGHFDPTDATKTSRGIFNHKAHMSTSIDPSQAHAHRSNDDLEHTHMLHLTLPKGYTGGRYIANHSDMPHEHEMLLKPQKFKIHKSETHGNVTIHHAKPYKPLLGEAKTPIPIIPNLFASIYHKSKKRPNGYTPEELKKINDKK